MALSVWGFQRLKACDTPHVDPTIVPKSPSYPRRISSPVITVHKRQVIDLHNYSGLVITAACIIASGSAA